MSRLLVLGFTISIDGYGAGPNQTLKEPLGVGGESLHKWLVTTPTFKKMFSKGVIPPAESDIDEEFAANSMAGMGAWIMGRNMFSASRGPWPDDNWRGWWGPNPPYHVPTFVLTNYKRDPIEMEGGTVFHFVTDGFESALERARDVAGSKDIRVGGGVQTIREYLTAGLIDEMHIAISPVILGSGEQLLAGIDLLALGYQCTRSVASPNATHYVISKT